MDLMKVISCDNGRYTLQKKILRRTFNITVKPTSLLNSKDVGQWVYVDIKGQDVRQVRRLVNSDT